MELHNLPDMKFKIMVIKILTEFKRAMYEQNENFNNEKITVPKNIIIELKKKIARGIQHFTRSTRRKNS